MKTAALVLFLWATFACPVSEETRDSASEACEEVLVDLFSEQVGLESWKNRLLDSPAVQGTENPRALALDDMLALAWVEREYEKAFPSYKTLRDRVIEISKLPAPRIERDEYIRLRDLALVPLSEPSPVQLFAQITAISLLQTVHSFTALLETSEATEPIDQPSDQEETEVQSKPDDRAQDPELSEERRDQIQVSNKDMKPNPNAKSFFAVGITARSAEAVDHFPLDHFENFFTGRLTKNFAMRSGRREASQVASGEKAFAIPKPGLTKIGLYTRYGHQPIVGSHGAFEIVQAAPQEYQARSLVLGQSLPERIDFPLAISPFSAPLTSEQIKWMQRSSGISKDKWPSYVREQMEFILSSHANPREQAEALAQYFVSGSDFHYSMVSEVGQSLFDQAQRLIQFYFGTQDFPLALANARIFNCDGASVLAATLVRDFLNLPSRVVIGRSMLPRPLLIDDAYYFVLDLTAPRHAWIEVYINGKWVPFEVTPQTRNSNSGGNQTQLEAKHQIREEAQNKNDSEPDDNTENSSVDRAETTLKEDPTEDSTVNEPEKKLPLAAVVAKAIAISTVLDHGYRFSSQQLQSAWGQFESFGHGSRGAISELKAKLFAHFPKFYQHKNKSVIELFQEAKRSLLPDPVRAYSKLGLVLEHFELLDSMAGLSEEEKKFVQGVQGIRAKMRLKNHPSAGFNDLVDRFFEDLPGEISKEILLKTYPEARRLGSEDQQRLAEALLTKEGPYKKYVQASLVRKHFNFLFNSYREYQAQLEQTLLRHHKREGDNQNLVIANLNDVARIALWRLEPDAEIDPDLAILGRLLKGEQLMTGFRQVESVPGTKDPIEREFTAIYIDESGSMEGAKAEIQAAAILALIDMNLSKKDPFGKPLSKVFLIPFGTSVGKRVEIVSVEQAVAEILKLANGEPKADSGTNIQSTFDDFESLVIEQSQTNASGDKLDQLVLTRANMVLMTDGDDPGLNLNRVESQIDGLKKNGFQIFLNLVSFVTHNRGLESLAKGSVGNPDHPMYIQLTGEQIARFIHESNHLTLNDDAFAPTQAIGVGFGLSDVAKLHFPAEDSRQLESKLTALVAKMAPSQHGVRVTRRNYQTAMSILELIQSQYPFTRQQKRHILHEILQQYLAMTGSPLDQLSFKEYEILRELVRWASK